jgi:hypothetical protein
VKGGGTQVQAKGGASPAPAAGTTVAGHLCPVSRLAGVARAHGTPAGTTVACPCGKNWRVTKHHLDGPDGRRGAICGCGWERTS